MHRGRYFSGNRYFDRLFGAAAVKLLPGQYFACKDDTLIMTVLGSCVSVCLFDMLCGVGGMNHFMLPGKADEAPPGKGSARYGIHAMQLLFDHVIQLGASANRLEAKVFGAGRVMDGMSDVGRQNSDFAERFLHEHGIRISVLDVGDIFPRKIYFSPASGKVFVRRLSNDDMSPSLP